MAEQPIIPIEEQFRIMADSAPVLIWISGVDKLCYFFNAGWLRFTGRTLEEECGNGWAEGVHPEDLERCLEIYTTAFDARQDFKMEYRLRRYDGVYRWLVDTGVPRYSANGAFADYIGSCMDIDELLESEWAKQESVSARLKREQAAKEELEANVKTRVAQLSASEERFKNLVQQAPVAIAVLHSRALVIESANEKMLEIWGKTREVIGTTLADALPEIRDQPFLDILDRVYTSGEPFYGNEVLAKLEHRGALQNLYVNFVYQPFINQTGQATDIIVVASEVTEQVAARQVVERALEQVRLSKEAASLGTFDMDLLNGTLVWDERCRELFGISHHGPVNYEDDFVKGLHPDDREHIAEVIHNVFIKAVSGGIYDVEYRTVGAEDQKLRWVRAKGQAYFDDQDQPVRFIGSVLDITEQKQDEQRKNDFIGMVSHELKTPLTSLGALIQVTQSKLRHSEDPFLRTAMDKANTQVKKMGAMINGFLNISRLESGKILLDKKPFNLDELVQEMIEEIQLISPGYPISLSPCQPVQVVADPDKIGSVISNLLSNAVKYSAKGTHIAVVCEISGEEVQLSVQDQGIGIKPADKAHLFDRFFRVDNPNSKHISGFGIGLYLSAEIIRQHQGRIWVESEPGQGSTFYFRIPAH